MRDVPALEASVSDLRGMDGAPLLVSSDPLYKELRHGIKGQFRRLGDQDVTCPHQKVRGIYRLEDILVTEYVNPAYVIIQGILAECRGLAPVIEMRLRDIRQPEDR